ncbi:beta-glucosidase [Belnapia sp. F-4-1]|uniref:beta-glucosidase n=1 Tax=Belnapia sp. F-4-1 TaxID=1545443 RepID=UPI001F489813|nr:beta-glucosidase [Belnapia sp. F-4-1]
MADLDGFLARLFAPCLPSGAARVETCRGCRHNAAASNPKLSEEADVDRHPHPPLTLVARRQLLAGVAIKAGAAMFGETPGAAAAPELRAPFRPGLFRSFFLGGFECSTQRRADGRRLDLIAATRHDQLAASDYLQLTEHGITAARDGVRWHLVEGGTPGWYDWSPVLPLLRAAEAAGVQVSWDLCHYGWPDGLDVFSVSFVDRLAHYAAAFARLHLQETGSPPVICPVNEISFLAWAGGDMARMNPAARGRGLELKRQLVRAAAAAARAVREATPGARILAIEPIIHVVPQRSEDTELADAWYNRAQFQAWDMLAGRVEPALGGGPETFDAVGVNYYWNNQWSCAGEWLPQGRWLCEGEPLSPFDPRTRPLHALLAAVHTRYGCPLFLAETSIEDDLRAPWLRHVGGEVREAVRRGVPVEGVCLYPILGHPGWDDDRYCANGLFELEPNGSGRRPVHAPLATELRWQQHLFALQFGKHPGRAN